MRTARNTGDVAGAISSLNKPVHLLQPWVAADAGDGDDVLQRLRTLVMLAQVPDAVRR
jgi:hypothetical protein